MANRDTVDRATTIRLRPITRANWQTCVSIEVRPDQRDFVASNAYSLAQAAYEPGLIPLAVYDAERDEMVGFLMYAELPDEQGRHWIYRVMIAPQQQGKGYGRALMLAAIARMRATIPTLREITLDFHKDNAVAERLYESLGFRKTGEVEGDEVFATLVIGGDRRNAPLTSR